MTPGVWGTQVVHAQVNVNSATLLLEAREKAVAIASSPAYERFVEVIRQTFPARCLLPSGVLDRDYFRIVDQHLQYLVPRVQSYMEPETRRVLDFGCGTGGSAIALAMACPDVRCCGTDIDADEIAVARERASLYGVADRCEFHHVQENQPLPFPDGFFDLCQCSSVLEYVVDRHARRFCIQEMVRLISQRGLLLVSVPNRLYPFEIHSWWRGKAKWGWNYFPRLLNANTVDSHVWEVKKYARPEVLQLHRTPVFDLLRPWSTFCLRRAGK